MNLSIFDIFQGNKDTKDIPLVANNYLLHRLYRPFMMLSLTFSPIYGQSFSFTIIPNSVCITMLMICDIMKFEISKCFQFMHFLLHNIYIYIWNICKYIYVYVYIYIYIYQRVIRESAQWSK